MDIVSILVGFLAGTATGASGSYFATKYTEKRQLKEKRKETNTIFLKIENDFPQLVNEMRQDLLKPNNSLKREFVLLDKKWSYSSPNQILCYYYNDHPHLDDIAKVIEDYGFISDISETSVKKYRFDMEFVEYLVSGK